jgi:hypothetical protein
VEVAEVDLPSPMPDDDPLALDEALEGLEEFDSRAAEAVKLRFFVGLTVRRQEDRFTVECIEAKTTEAGVLENDSEDVTHACAQVQATLEAGAAALPATHAKAGHMDPGD